MYVIIENFPHDSPSLNIDEEGITKQYNTLEELIYDYEDCQNPIVVDLEQKVVIAKINIERLIKQSKN